jgi:hypothetical protein
VLSEIPAEWRAAVVAALARWQVAAVLFRGVDLVEVSAFRPEIDVTGRASGEQPQ